MMALVAARVTHRSDELRVGTPVVSRRGTYTPKQHTLRRVESTLGCIAQMCTSHAVAMRLTYTCSGSRSRLWKSDQCSSGSCSSGLRTRVVDSAVLELHADVLVGLWRCVLRHGGGECEGTVSPCSANRPIPLNKD